MTVINKFYSTTVECNEPSTVVECTIKFKNKLTHNECALNKLLSVSHKRFYVVSALTV